jgi:hypothetical protein
MSPTPSYVGFFGYLTLARRWLGGETLIQPPLVPPDELAWPARQEAADEELRNAVKT